MSKEPSIKTKPIRAVHLAIIAVCTSLLSSAGQACAQTPPDFVQLNAKTLEPTSAPLSVAASREMISVPAGSYPIGRANGYADQRPAHRVVLKAFRIDRTEVTNGAFAEYLNALDFKLKGSFGVGGISGRNGSSEVISKLSESWEGSGLYPIIALDDDQARIIYRAGRFQAAAGYEDHPVAETTWAGAKAYCRWRGGNLPSEAQWEAAARGVDDRLYPWGNDSVYNQNTFISGRSGITGAVGRHPTGASPFGVLDMAGSMAEWTSSLKRPYPYDATDDRENPTRSGERVTRGGDYLYDRTADTLTVSHRNGYSNAPGRGHRHIGFRCAAL